MRHCGLRFVPDIGRGILGGFGLLPATVMVECVQSFTKIHPVNVQIATSTKKIQESAVLYIYIYIFMRANLKI